MATPRSLTISWSPGYSGGENLDQWFLVDYREYVNSEPGDWLDETKVTDGSNRYELSGLKEGTTYDIRVFSENEVGRSLSGQTIQGKTTGKQKKILKGLFVFVLFCFCFLVFVPNDPCAQIESNLDFIN